MFHVKAELLTPGNKHGVITDQMIDRNTYPTVVYFIMYF